MTGRDRVRERRRVGMLLKLERFVMWEKITALSLTVILLIERSVELHGKVV
jgi:hypothetical protein